ncbi:MAG: YHS domain-containing protein [Candidatus Aminicenantes bacterium]|nr:YHS domain-containing protein [Candidatus Aminicenantes bacterium]MDH5383182.1 YHS domain-containing protein [Candidatus Aminicenantes bacterium]MDH5742683.1 YHS domain-containing protein [Candidatus Aminicenantes bacterium]
MVERVKDLVCGMEFDKETASGTFEYKGKFYYFCSLGCRNKFAEDPKRYIAQEAK